MPFKLLQDRSIKIQILHFYLQEHNEALILAEAEKQQALSMKETEKNALQEKLGNLNHVVQDMEQEYEKLKRSAASQHEKDRVRTTVQYMQLLAILILYSIRCL